MKHKSVLMLSTIILLGSLYGCGTKQGEVFKDGVDTVDESEVVEVIEESSEDENGEVVTEHISELYPSKSEDEIKKVVHIDGIEIDYDTKSAITTFKLPSDIEKNLTHEEYTAVKYVVDMLTFTPYSEPRVRERMDFREFDEDVVDTAINLLPIDWMEMAHLKAVSYLRTAPYSKLDLKTQLVFSGFTEDESNYGVASVNNKTDWKANALSRANKLVNGDDNEYYSHDFFILHMTTTFGFTDEEVAYVDKNFKANWDDEAEKLVEYMLGNGATKNGIVTELEFRKFTEETINKVTKDLK